MIARQATWKEVWVGSYISDKTGRVWKDVDMVFAGPTVILKARDGARGEIPWPPDDRPVTIWEPTMEDATKLVGELLDAKEV
jgi:hypothetical protein